MHRDIKPKNIIVTDQPGQPDFVKVLDFGLARSLEGAGVGTQGAIGTPKYMAPEQWQNEGVGSHTDLYAVGCVLFEMIAGRPPFVPKDSNAPQAIPLNWMHLHEAAPDLTEYAASDLPPALADISARLLSKNPGDRPSSAVEVINTLDDLTSSQPTGEHAPTLPVLRLRPAPVGSEAADSPGTDAAPQEGKPPATSPPMLALVLSAVVGLCLLGLFLALGRGGDGAKPGEPTPAATEAAPAQVQPAPKPEQPGATTLTPEPAGEEKQAEEPAGPPPKTTYLSLRSTPPRADVIRNGQPLCTTPCDMDLASTGKREVLEVRARGHKPARVEVVLEQGGQIYREVKLSAEPDSPRSD